MSEGVSGRHYGKPLQRSSGETATEYPVSTSPYIRDLVKLPSTGPAFSVAWLLLPWAALTAWALKVGTFITAASGAANGFVDFLAVGGLVQFQLVAGVALLLTWGLLYVAWPSHRRVFCWVAAAAYVAGWAIVPAFRWHATPSYLHAMIPVLTAGSVIAAVIGQSYAARAHPADVSAPAA